MMDFVRYKTRRQSKFAAQEQRKDEGDSFKMTIAENAKKVLNMSSRPELMKIQNMHARYMSRGEKAPNPQRGEHIPPDSQPA